MVNSAVGKQSGSRVRSHLYALAVVLAIALIPHLPYLSVPYFWDELGQFVPASLDIMRDFAWVPHSTVPNVHPPAVMAYLALTWRVFGYSAVVTRVAMLVMAAFGFYFAFLLAIRVGRFVPGAPAFASVLLLIATPLVFMQSMMAQLDMPAMVFTTLALWLFLEDRPIACAAACTALVLCKETGAVLPALCMAWLIIRERRFRDAAWFVIPFVALAVWLVVLKRATGEWLGDAGFAHYNVGYALSPMRVFFAFLRRFWFLFGSDFRWIGTAGIIYGLRRTHLFQTREWAFLTAFFAGHVALVSLFGGATLERYLLPVFPIFYIAVATGWASMPRLSYRTALAALGVGLVAGLYWNPPYPFPHENNLAMVDFVSLQQAASEVIERDASLAIVASAWPYTAGFRNPDLGFLHRSVKTVETNDFHPHNVIDAVQRGTADVVVLYSRTWDGGWSVLNLAPVDAFLRRYYDYEPQITAPEMEQQLGMQQIFRFEQRGQWVEGYARRYRPELRLPEHRADRMPEHPVVAGRIDPK